MPRKPTGRPSGRPGKPYRHYPGWIVTAVEAFVSGDFTTKLFPSASRHDAQSGVLAFNRARKKKVEECLAEGHADEADVALDIIARATCDPISGWQIELSARGLALDAFHREQERRQALVADSMERFVLSSKVEDFETRIAREVAEGPPKARELSAEELAERDREIAESRARDKAATERWRSQQDDAKSEEDIDRALEEPQGAEAQGAEPQPTKT